MHGDAVDAAPASLTVRRIGRDTAIAFWDVGASNSTHHAEPCVAGASVAPPVARMRARTRWGGRRLFVAFRFEHAPVGGADRPVAMIERIDGASVVAAACDAGRGEEPLDVATLLEGLDDDGRIGIARFLMEVCRSGFRLGDDPIFCDLAGALIDAFSANPGEIRPRLAVAADLVLCTGTIPAGFGAPSSAVVVGRRAVRQARFAPAPVGRRLPNGQRGFVLMLDRGEAGEGLGVIVFGSSGLACRRMAHGAAPLDTPLPRALPRSVDPDGGVRDYVLRCLARQAQTEPAAAAAIEEFRLLHAPARASARSAPPSAQAELTQWIAVPGGGMFAAGWIADPHGLVAGVRLRDPSGGSRDWNGAFHRFAAPDNARKPGEARRDMFVGFHPEADATIARPMAALRSGAGIELTPPPPPVGADGARDAVLASLPGACLNQAMLADCIAPAAQRLQAQHLATMREPEVVRLGCAAKNPRVSIIVPLYKTLDFLRFQFAAFAVDAELRDAELIYVLDSPEQRHELLHYLRGLHLLYDVPIVVAVMSGNFGYAAANNAGVALARGRQLLLLNSDVVPERPGWLGAMTRALGPDTAAVGAKLLFDDDSLQHAGLYFERDTEGAWYNRHYFKGFPRDFAPAGAAREVPAVTGACMLVHRAAYERAGGLCQDYLIGDYEDSDLCLRLREQGLLIRYAPEAELYHFERRSIEQSTGYMRGVAAEHNRWLHHRRWDDALERLMSRAPAPKPARRPRTRRRADFQLIAATWAQRLSAQDDRRKAIDLVVRRIAESRVAAS